VEEPQLGQHEGGREQGRGANAERRRDQWDERHQPDDVLRREESREGQEQRHRRRRRRDEPLAHTGSAPREEPDDQENRGGLQHARRQCERIGKRAFEVP
jgi:hypothetical protein